MYHVNNQMELEKFKSAEYFPKSLLEIRAEGFSKEDAIRCSNTTDAVENRIMWQKAMPTYREGDMLYI